MTVEIDSQSGFCGGVIRAIGEAEKYLEKSGGKHLFSLGDIVHNEAELQRLAAKGLVTIDKEDMAQMIGVSGETLLIRAHGEPPKTYVIAKALGFDIVDCTCPVVLKIQQSIKNTYDRLKVEGEGGQILIFGKIGHAEVLGLVGQVDGDAVVVENVQQLETLCSEGNLRLDAPIEVFSQTTMSPSDYKVLCSWLSDRVADACLLNIHDTICRQVAFRHQQLASFAMNHDAVVFVSGKTSSNGNVLSNLCKSVNIRTYNVCGVEDIHAEWFRKNDKIGVCGATSTPKWLLEEVAVHIQNLQ